MIVLTPNPNYKFEVRDSSNGGSDELVIKESWVENVYDVHDGDFADNKICIDLGANIGAFSIFAVSLADDVEVFAYEPETNNMRLLGDNCRNNRVHSRVHIIKQAVSDKHGYGRISNSEGNSQLVDDKNAEEVPIVTLHEVFADNKIDECAVMKVDVEGAEYDIFTKADVDDLMRIKYLTMEFTETSAEKFGLLIASLSRAFNLHIVGVFNRGGYIYGRRY